MGKIVWETEWWLPPAATQRKFRPELSKMHTLCLALLERKLATT
jgi:hypothetical protein